MRKRYFRLIVVWLFAFQCLVGLLPAADFEAGGKPVSPVSVTEDKWESAYLARSKWWSLQRLSTGGVPSTRDSSWARTDVDRYILAALEAKGLRPVPEAGRQALARRLAFALTGLPPDRAEVERLVADPSSEAYERYVDRLLGSPHFGERWARHWLDVVHYADTHGYEWDTPAKNAWRYRDYVVRALNADLSIRRFLLEQIAGDLIEPRVNAESGINEAILATMAFRLGERRHGDNAAAEGVTQEAIANVIDTLGKGFLATTVACAQCHDHKLDAVEQRDYYAMAGVFMSTRWTVRTVNATDPNLPVIDELRRLKRSIRSELWRLWSASSNTVITAIRSLPVAASNAPPAGFPGTLRAYADRLRSGKGMPTMADYRQECARRADANRTNLTLVADFSRESESSGWRWDGFGMKHGLVKDGELVITDSGDAVIQHLLPAGRWSHVWSQRLAGALRSPLIETRPAVGLSVEFAAGRFASEAFILDHAFHSERMQFPSVARPAWRTLKAGDFDTLEGGLDHESRRVYLEWATKSLNNYFPPRTGYGGVKETDLDDERSWFGASRIYQHAPGKPPLDELARFAPLHESDDKEDIRLAKVVLDAVDRWGRDDASADDVRLLNEALELGWLPNLAEEGSELARWVERYRTVAQTLESDVTIGGMADWEEGRDERIGIRGSYTQLGDEVPRGNIRFLGGAAKRACAKAGGRLELGLSIADDGNPLTARVFVNRVWLYLFGQGLVRTPDDFGHLGETPSHPELLDFLARRFMAEGWSLKRLIKLLVTSATWRQDSRPDEASESKDPENRLWHHMPVHRLDAESIRESILAASGRLDRSIGGPPVDPPRASEDPAKRLMKGPLDGKGRRSLYLKVTLMEPPRFLALFNQPIPKLTTGRRDVTSVPDQALALLNDPFVVSMARYWSERVLRDGSKSSEARVRLMISEALSRPSEDHEVGRLLALVQTSARHRGWEGSNLLDCQPVWQDVAHALFNLKEFIHVR